ncbi:HlyD family secretion protein [Kaistia dalseonensis]|uniref:Membrane fusion protein (Multidrug efflux system) n=1 Tax=Kaistia dalseonensis TaxID=410840 RepID=A0ABU0HB34_9HYPH|nr:HlyD family secretion protein [Kaistia dalseonensis]MCX5496893.1 HlyD family secretion protein [Kaistia dalseonensis]MDQ0439519.1 membrane fusion protein (multidrug efflux system) [Kaistia dalseonensis]
MSAEPKPREAADASNESRPAAPVLSIAPPPTAPKRRGRIALMLALPIVLAIGGGYLWLTGGRYVSTDNAYLEQNRVTITADQSGRIVEVAVHENDHVKKGDLLFRIDPEPYEIALRQADAAVATARLQVEQLRSAYQQALVEQKTAEDTLAYQEKNFQRQQDLLARGVASNAAFDDAQNNLRVAEQAVAQAKEKVVGALTGLGGNPDIKTEDHPAVQQAMAADANAALALKQTSAFAPADGVVSQTDRLRVGQYVTNPAMAPTALMSLVETGTTYVEANFKETDLTHMKVGQKATVTLDTYPDRPFEAKVESIDAGTGSVFSLLPAQNATGNWVKVVQRIPVRLKLDGTVDVAALRAGMSAAVDVDTEYHRSLPGLGQAVAGPNTPATP